MVYTLYVQNVYSTLIQQPFYPLHFKYYINNIPDLYSALFIHVLHIISFIPKPMYLVVFIRVYRTVYAEQIQLLCLYLLFIKWYVIRIIISVPSRDHRCRHLRLRHPEFGCYATEELPQRACLHSQQSYRNECSLVSLFRKLYNKFILYKE